MEERIIWKQRAQEEQWKILLYHDIENEIISLGK
jgi:hypothetical protein